MAEGTQIKNSLIAPRFKEVYRVNGRSFQKGYSNYLTISIGLLKRVQKLKNKL